jgi:hypothetical protein
MEGEPVHDRRAEPGIGEGLGWTAGERLVGGDREAVLLLPLRQNLEEHLGAAAVEFEIAALVDLQKVDASVAGDGLAELLVVGSLGQLVHQGRSGGVADPLSTHSRGHVRDTVRVDS